MATHQLIFPLKWAVLLLVVGWNKLPPVKGAAVFHQWLWPGFYFLPPVLNPLDPRCPRSCSKCSHNTENRKYAVFSWPVWLKRCWAKSISLCCCSHQLSVDYGLDYFLRSDSDCPSLLWWQRGWQRWHQGAHSVHVGVPALGNRCSANERLYSVATLGNLPDVVRHDQIILILSGEVEEADKGRGHRSWDRDNKQPFPLSSLKRILL